MGKLEFSPDRIDSLRTALMAGIDQLNDLRPADRAASEEARLIDRVVQRLGDWYPLLSGIIQSDVMSRYQPRRGLDGIDLTAPRSSAPAPNGQPAAGPLLIELEDLETIAQDLAREIIDGNYADLTSGGNLARLAATLQRILADPAARRLFLANLGPAGIAELVRRLGDRRYELSVEHDDDGLAAIDQIWAQLGAALDDYSDADRDWVLEHTSPIIAAHLIAGMSLSAHDIARLTKMVVERDLDPRIYSPPITAGGQDRAADILLPRIAANPSASLEFMKVLGSDFACLFDGGGRSSAPQIVLNATDPTLVTVAQAGEIATKLYGYLGRGVPIDWQSTGDLAFLGQIVMWYPTRFAGELTTWPWQDEDAIDALQFMLSDPTTASMLQDLDWSTSFGPIDMRNPAARDARLHQINLFLTYLIELTSVQRVLDEISRAATFNLIARIVDDATGIAVDFGVGVAVPGVGPFGGAVVSAAASKPRAAALDWILSHVPGRPPSRGAVEKGAAEDLDVKIALAAWRMVEQTFWSLVECGEIDREQISFYFRTPPGIQIPRPGEKFCAGTEYAGALAAWIEQLRLEGIDERTLATLVAAGSISNAEAAAKNCIAAKKD